MNQIASHKAIAVDEMLKAGASYRQIQNIVGVSRQTIQTRAIAMRGNVGALCEHQKQRYLCAQCRPNGRWNKPPEDILRLIAAQPFEQPAEIVDIQVIKLGLLAHALSDQISEIETLIRVVREKIAGISNALS